MAKVEEIPSDEILLEMVSRLLRKQFEQNQRGTSRFEEKLSNQLEYVVDTMLEELIAENESLIREAVEKVFRRNVSSIAKEITEAYIEERS